MVLLQSAFCRTRCSDNLQKDSEYNPQRRHARREEHIFCGGACFPVHLCLCRAQKRFGNFSNVLDGIAHVVGVKFFVKEQLGSGEKVKFILFQR